MKQLPVTVILVLITVALLSGCAEFLEDYQYNSIGEFSSAGY